MNLDLEERDRCADEAMKVLHELNNLKFQIRKWTDESFHDKDVWMLEFPTLKQLKLLHIPTYSCDQTVNDLEKLLNDFIQEQLRPLREHCKRVVSAYVES